MNQPVGVRVRQATEDDEAALTELDAMAWSPRSGFPSVIERHHAQDFIFFSADNPPEAFLVAESAGVILGYVRLTPPSRLPEHAHVMLIGGIAVHPSARRRGLAAALLAASEVHAVNEGARKLSLRVLGTNEPAIILYERSGFHREGVLREEFLINGVYVDDVFMAKLLPARA